MTILDILIGFLDFSLESQWAVIDWAVIEPILPDEEGGP